MRDLRRLLGFVTPYRRLAALALVLLSAVVVMDLALPASAKEGLCSASSPATPGAMLRRTRSSLVATALLVAACGEPPPPAAPAAPLVPPLPAASSAAPSSLAPAVKPSPERLAAAEDRDPAPGAQRLGRGAQLRVRDLAQRAGRGLCASAAPRRGLDRDARRGDRADVRAARTPSMAWGSRSTRPGESRWFTTAGA